MKTQTIVDWVVSNFESYSSHIYKIAIYGSIARSVDRPNDCDLIIVALVNVESQPWLSLRRHISIIKNDFLEKFELPINVALLTKGEWDENKSFYKDMLSIKN